MRLFPDDRRFEEAGRIPELCEELLKDLQRARKNNLFLTIFVGVVLLAVLGWLSVMFNRAVLAISTGASPPPVVDWLLAHQVIFFVSGVPLLCFFGWSFLLIMSLDTRIKVLLFLHGQQNRPS